MIANEQFSDINFMLIYVRYNAGPSVRNVPYNFKQDITELFLDYNLKIREMPHPNPLKNPLPNSPDPLKNPLPNSPNPLKKSFYLTNLMFS